MLVDGNILYIQVSIRCIQLQDFRTFLKSLEINRKT